MDQLSILPELSARLVSDEKGDVTEAAPQTSLPPLRFDPEEYRKYVEDENLTVEQAEELLGAIWLIMTSFVDMGFGIHPVQHVLNGRKKTLATDSRPGLDSSRTRKKQQNKAGRAFARAAGKRDS